ncbi:MAG: aminotransferase class III-fold pyridoxal phosphate-dependent enzyme [Pirellulaceae bacterium]|nr:aminotransferase class III-fold pyridoxal phosphate-dependent enzyme [Pirellulaceae bacterium]
MGLVLGEGGIYPGGHDFLVALMQVLANAGGTIFVDEIQTFGRTTAPFAYQYFDLDQYVQVATVGGMMPLCATLFTGEFKPDPGLISQTFTASNSTLGVAQTVLDALCNGDFFGPDGRVARLAKRLVNRLESIAACHPEWVRGSFGLGAMVAFTPFDGRPDTAKILLSAQFDAGPIAFVTGADPARVRSLVPMGCVGEKDIDADCDILERTLGKIAQPI